MRPGICTTECWLTALTVSVAGWCCVEFFSRDAANPLIVGAKAGLLAWMVYCAAALSTTYVRGRQEAKAGEGCVGVEEEEEQPQHVMGFRLPSSRSIADANEDAEEDDE